MRISRPTPAMAVAILALVVALGGTATAASVVLIKSSSQVRAGSLTGSDLKTKSLTNRTLGDGAVTGRAIKPGSVTAGSIKKGAVGTDQLATSVKSALIGQGFTATESVRRDGPSAPNGGSMKIATLQGLAPGTYTLIAKTIVSPLDPSGGIFGELVKGAKTATASCTLDGAGDTDDALAPVGTPFALYANTLNLQLTRTIATPSDITLSCDAPIAWKAGNTSIIALKLSGSSRVDSAG
jgi:hypothetical protein